MWSLHDLCRAVKDRVSCRRENKTSKEAHVARKRVVGSDSTDQQVPNRTIVALNVFSPVPVP